MPTKVKWRTAILLALVGLITGCGAPVLQAPEPFRLAKTWQLEQEAKKGKFCGVSLAAELTPDPLRPDKPAMLVVHIDTGRPEKKFTGRVWYRFAFRRGDRRVNESSPTLPPLSSQEEGVEPRFEDWFEWAEIVEPRIEQGKATFETPVMFNEGKAYVQFRVSETADSPPLELLDWFVYAIRAQ